MLKIRLTRIGKRNDPVYRVVVAEDSTKPKGSVIEVLGFWHPRPNLIKINKNSILAWQKKGAEVTPAVKRLLEAKN